MADDPVTNEAQLVISARDTICAKEWRDAPGNQLDFVIPGGEATDPEVTANADQLAGLLLGIPHSRPTQARPSTRQRSPRALEHRAGVAELLLHSGVLKVEPEL